MTARDFCYWLQGFVEVADTPKPTEREWQIIKDHLKEVDILKTLHPLGQVLTSSATIGESLNTSAGVRIRPLREIPESDSMNMRYC